MPVVSNNLKPADARPKVVQAARSDPRDWAVQSLLDPQGPRRDDLPAIAAPRDRLFVDADPALDPLAVFGRLRWGGQAVLSADKPRQIEALHQRFAGRPEWLIEKPVASVELPRRKLLFFRQHRHFFVARKVLLEPESRPTFRHSFDVRLTPAPNEAEGCCVLKRIPDPVQVRRRLLQNLPPDQQPDEDAMEGMIRKLISKVFPLFLTREAGFLKILQRDLPEHLRHRVPTILGLERDSRGLVCMLKIRWLRLGGPAIEPIEFARQAAELLREVHDRVGIVHLDLRLDNFLITPSGVGLVDFGSALRRGEDVTASAILTKLFTEMLSASQVRQDYLRMKHKGLITSAAFDDCYQPPGPGADLFSVVNNFARLQEHPDFVGLFRPSPEQDAELVRLRREVFKPANPRLPSVNKMGDLYRVLCGEASLNEPAVPLSAMRAQRVETPDPAGSSADPAFADLSIDLPTDTQDSDAPAKLPTGLF